VERLTSRIITSPLLLVMTTIEEMIEEIAVMMIEETMVEIIIASDADRPLPRIRSLL